MRAYIVPIELSCQIYAKNKGENGCLSWQNRAANTNVLPVDILLEELNQESIVTLRKKQSYGK